MLRDERIKLSRLIIFRFRAENKYTFADDTGEWACIVADDKIHVYITQKNNTVKFMTLSKMEGKKYYVKSMYDTVFVLAFTKAGNLILHIGPESKLTRTMNKKQYSIRNMNYVFSDELE